MNSPIPATSDAETLKTLSAPKAWTRHLVRRFALLLGAYVLWLGCLAFVTTNHWISDQSRGAASPARPQTMYQAEPGIARAIFVALAIAILIETVSIVWRVSRRSHRFGVTGMVVAGLTGVASVLGMLTIGPFVAPFAVVCLMLALPIGSVEPPTRPTPTAGWFNDPSGQTQLRYWNGRAWTSHVAVSPDRAAPESRHGRP